MSLEKALRIVDERFDWCVEFLKKMVSVATVNPPGENFGEFVNLFAEELQKFSEVEIVEVPQKIVEEFRRDLVDHPRYIAIAKLGRGEPVLEINGHYDVVPPGDGWSRDPFKPVVENGKLYGRGAVDMKGGLAAAALAMRALAEAGTELMGSLEILAVPDEEIGGVTGTGYALRSGLVRPRWVIIAEPSSVDTIWIGHRGALWLYVEVLGKQAHASTPWLGENAFTKAAKLVARLEDELCRRYSERRSSYPYDDERAAHPTITIGGETRGGTKINTVPGRFVFSIDRRLIVEEKLDEVEKELREAIDSICKEIGCRTRIEIVNRLPPALTDPNNELVEITREAIEKIIGRTPKTVVCSGGLDMWYYTTRGIPTITYGPGPMEQAHKPNEYVELQQIRDVAKTYVYIAHKLLAKK